MQPHRIARTDQYLADGSARLDQMIGEYRTLAKDKSVTEAAGIIALAARLGHDHAAVAWIATVAIQRLAALEGPPAEPGNVVPPD